MNSSQNEIDLMDLLYRICSRWRVILIWMIAGALLLNAYAVWDSMSAVKIAREDPNETLKRDIADVKSLLSVREIDEVEQGYTSYEQLMSTCSGQNAYLTKSIVMNMNPRKVPTYNLQYQVVSSQPMGVGEAVITLFQKQLLDEQTCSDINGVFADGNEYAQELVTVEESSEPEDISLDEAKQKVTMFSIVIIADDKEHCEAIAEIMEVRANEFAKTVQQMYPGSEIKRVAGEYSVAVNTKMSETQKFEYEKMNSMRNSMTLLKNGFSDNQKKYLNLLWKSEHMDDAIEETANSDVVQTVSYVNAKFILVGMMMGLFLYAALKTVCYIASSKLHTAGELQRRYDLTVFGEPVWMSEKRLSGLDKGVYHKLRGREIGISVELLDRIAQEVVMQAEDGDTILLSGTADTEKISELQKLLSERIKSEKITLCEAGSVLDDVTALEKLQEVQGVILVERIGHSLKSDIKKELELCERYTVPVMGAITVEEWK